MKRSLTAALATAALALPIGASAQVPLSPSTQMRQVPSSQMEVQLSYAPVVAETAPAVVNIFTSRTVRRRQTTGSDFFDRMFGMGRAPQERVENSLGSGVIVRSDGTVVTNAHVIRGADELRVVLNDRREFDAKVVAQDEDLDIAVLQIDTNGEPLPTLRLQQDSDREIGDIVLAIGNPFGVGQTVTSGIISALGRTNVSNSSSFIQTDAAVNPGNSGGALVNLSGELIGVNTAIFSRSGGSNGIGFAIPAELVRRAVDSALSTGEIVRPWIGARTDAVDATMAAALGLDRARGAVINELLDAGPAAEAGLRKGDVILSVGGTPVNDDNGLRFKLATLRTGNSTRIAYMRDGRERTANVRIDTPKEDPPRDERLLLGMHPLDGATVVNLSPALGEELGFDPYLSGVMVMKVQRRAAAHYNRLRPGDIIVSVNDRAIRTTRDAERVLDAEGGADLWEIEIDRQGRIALLPVRALPNPT
ncbi:Do family serine endopeptidase [uncultured Algimonas sp.]|uniref:Do family serine endopeptidase n=1 Tax=uncultured Algimonas sp. TaxID=1547920 RepID=UPI00260B860A|nr:Do family serine endopeptidase [uncultured Algimonas sp.]